MFFRRYKDYYNEDGTFDLAGYRLSQQRVFDVIGEIFLFVLFAGFYTWGGINLYWFIDNFRDEIALLLVTYSASGLADIIHEHAWQVVGLFISVYVITLLINYMIVKFFSKMAAWFMYGTGILQIIMFGLIFYYLGTFDPSEIAPWIRWLFLIPIVLQIVIMVVWHKKFALAIEYTKMSCLVVWKERKLLIPQFVQTFLVFSLFFFHFIVTANTFFDIGNYAADVITFGPDTSVSLNETYAYIGYTVGFILLAYVVIYITLTMKINMVHHWYRGGNLSFWHAFGIARRRWWATIMYALASTAIHSIKWVKKILKGEVDPKNLFEAMKTSFDMIPEDPMALEPFAKQKRQAKRAASKEAGGIAGIRKRGIRFGLLARMRWRRKFRKEVPLYKRIWLALNYFTLPAISIEDKPFFLALPRSLQTVFHNIPDLYIKQSNVNKLFKFTKFASIGLSAMVGGVIGWVIGYMGDIGWIPDFASKTTLVIACAILFGFVGAMSSLLVLNDLNMSYVTLMYIHTIDEINGKEGYTRFNLEPHEHITARIEEKKIKRDRRRQRWGLKSKYKEAIDASDELSDFQPELD
ncbi:MAG: hypothetical protein ACTSRE_15885 [Promethearchaeota archaeon]